MTSQNPPHPPPPPALQSGCQTNSMSPFMASPAGSLVHFFITSPTDYRTLCPPLPALVPAVLMARFRRFVLNQTLIKGLTKPRHAQKLFHLLPRTSKCAIWPPTDTRCKCVVKRQSVIRINAGGRTRRCRPFTHRARFGGEKYAHVG